MKIFLASIALVCATVSYSQSGNRTLGVPKKSGDKTVYYSLVYDEPEKLQTLSLILPIWNLAGSKINTSLFDVNVGLMYYNPKFQLFARYKYGLGDKIAPDSYEFSEYPNHSYIFSVNKVPKAQELNILGTYFFKSSKIGITESIHLKQSGNTSTVTNIPATALKNVGVNFGYAQGFTWYNMKDTKITTVTEGKSSEFELGSMTTVQTYKFVKFGFTFSKAINVQGDFEGYGKRTSASLKTTWFNVMYAVQNKFDDVYVPSYTEASYEPNTMDVFRASMDNSNKKLPIGFEIGQRFTDKKSIFAMEYGIKYLPGLMANNNLLVELGINLNFNFLKKQ